MSTAMITGMAGASTPQLRSSIAITRRWAMIDRIFDAFVLMSDEIHKQDAINKKQAQINSVKEHRCGNCANWMKVTCIPEKTTGNKKSMNSLGCELFDYDFMSIKLAGEFEAELQAIKNVSQSKR
jgi:hypothetical protein